MKLKELIAGSSLKKGVAFFVFSLILRSQSQTYFCGLIGGKMSKLGVFVMFCLVLSGCVASIYTKQVQVNRDASGNIINSTEIETIQQRGATDGIRFKNLKVVE